jgi:hypothetical protein
MKMLAEYLESAIKFERLAAEEKDAATQSGMRKTGDSLPETRRKACEEIQPCTAAKIGLRH